MPDKHASLVPTAHYTALTGTTIKKFAPDFPFPDDSTFQIGGVPRDIAWNCRPYTMSEWIVFGIPPDGILKQEVDVTVQITFQCRSAHGFMPAVPTLHQFVDVTKDVVNRLAAFA
jgi:hypothetical protein